MRNYGVLPLALLVAAPVMANNAVGKTYFSQHNWFGAASPERLAMARNRMNRKDEGKGVAFEAVLFAEQTTDEQGLRDYFLPFEGKTKLIAGETGSTAYTIGTNNPTGTVGAADLVAGYFNVQTGTVGSSSANLTSQLTFQSELSFAPKQTVVGIGLQWQQRLPKKWWLKVSAPITHVKNDLHMTEDVINEGKGVSITGAVANMTAAFKQEAMRYGKIDGAQEKWGVADIEVLVGRHGFDHEYAQACWYVGMVIPTGKKPTAEYLWEAVVGNNKHFGVMLGGSTRLVWKEGDDYVLAVCCDTNGRFLFENTQKRMLDLKGKPWSRYFLLVKEADFPTSGNFEDNRADLELGVNVLTQDVKVAPHGSFTGNTALNFRKDNGFEAEVGFNLYVREAEKIKLKNAFANADNYGIPYLGSFVDSAAATTNSFQTINRAFIDEGGDAGTTNTFLALAEADLDLNSAAHPAVYENTVYATLGMNWDKCKMPVFVNVGGAYTFNENNACAKRWGIWGKAGVSF